MKKIEFIFILFFLFSCTVNKKPAEKQNLYVFAAASLSDVIAEVADSFVVGKNVAVKLNLAASGTLARQIEQGAESDVFLSANKSWMDYLVEKNLSKDAGVFVSNDLVLIASPGDSTDISDVVSLLKSTDKKVAIGDPGYVPAGKYAQQVFDYYQLDLSSKLLPTNDVRSALMMVEMGEAGYGIVYKTDAVQSGKVHVVYTFPEESHKPVDYYRVLTSDKALAKEFYDYLYSPKAKAILGKYQFKTN